MAHYIPDTLLLNHAYLPFFSNPITTMYTCSKDFDQLEIGNDGLVSNIALNKNINGVYQPVIPFIDISKYDAETKDWFWYDSDSFPLRQYRENNTWVLRPIWDFGEHNNNTLTFDPNNLLNGGIESGFYSKVSNSIRVYYGGPIFMTINEEVIKDKTLYGESEIKPNLTKLNTDTNKEFYFNPDTNKIYTNQNLTSVDPSQIKLYFKTLSNEIIVKCSMAANSGEDAYSTPTVDYYIVKLNGQYLKG